MYQSEINQFIGKSIVVESKSSSQFFHQDFKFHQVLISSTAFSKTLKKCETQIEVAEPLCFAHKISQAQRISKSFIAI